MEFSIKQATSSGTWFKCEVKKRNNISIFNIRLVSFEKVILSNLDDWELRMLEPGELWLLEMDIVNFTKKEICPKIIRENIVLLNKEHLEFNTLRNLDFYKTLFADANGIRRFSKGDYNKLLPKIKVSGALPYMLPLDNEIEHYMISIKNGTIQKM